MPETEITPSVKNVFPTFKTVQEADDHLQAQLPVTTFNELYALVMVYHNTLLLTQSQ